VTLDAFLTLFPEFVETNPILVQGKLQLAAARMGGPDQTVWGPTASPGNPPTLADAAQANLAAHYLMSTPAGVSTLLAQPKDGSGSTTYLQVFLEYEQAVAGGIACAGVVI
jgi:hypothetical protein